MLGGAAAYALSRTAEPSTTTSPPGNAGGVLAQQCAALQTQLTQLRASPTPDRAQMARLESQIAACIAEARAAGGDIDNVTSNLSTGDSAFQRIEAWFDEYKRTDYGDLLKRNNIRKEMLDTGESMARTYADAVTAATDATSARVARQSILRALDTAVSRRLCYLYDQPGCGRLGVNEDHGNDKARQEQQRIIAPLMTAQQAAFTKLRNLRGAWGADDAGYFATLLRPASVANDYIAAKFAEYKSVDYSDALRRNNLRQEILAAGREMTGALKFAGAEAIAHNDMAALRSVASLLSTAVGASVTRWLCFILDQPGCGRFGVNEDHGNDKAQQEWTATIGPLFDLWAQVARALVAGGDVTAFEPLVLTKLARCAAIGSFVDAKFGEYKSVDYADAIRRNNLRQVVLQFGGILASCLQDAMSTAVTGAAARPASVYASAIAAAATRSTPLFLNFQLSGLGAGLPTTTTTPAQAAINAGIKNVKAVMVAAKTALDAAITRQLCFLYNANGCGTFGVNEDSTATKASQEFTTTVRPLMNTVAQGTTFLIGAGDPKAEEALISSKLRYCTALVDYINAKHAEYQTVPWDDAVRRNNLRVGEVRNRAANELVPCLRSTAPTTPAGRALVKVVADRALAASRARAQCYGDSSSACGRFGWNEDDNATKVAQETSMITAPLADISARLASGQALSGLGDEPAWTLPVAWVGVAAIGAIVYYGTKQRGGEVRANRSRRRTSRAVA